jgi:hypothetical protein
MNGNDKDQLIRSLTYLVNSGIREFEQEVCRIMAKNSLPALPLQMIVEQTIPKTPGEVRRQEKSESYYLANAVGFVRVAKQVFEPYNQFAPSVNSTDSHTIGNMIMEFNEFITDALYFLATLEAFRNVPSEQRKYLGYISKSPVKHHISMYQTVLVLLHEQGSFHSPTYLDPSFAVAILRQLIELRLRRSIGVMGAIRNETFEPVQMKIIFAALRTYQSEVQLSIPLSNVERIYAWSNLFLHGATTDFIWKSHLAMEYLDVLFVSNISELRSSPTKIRSWNVNDGVVISADALRKIRDTILADIQDHTSWSRIGKQILKRLKLSRPARIELIIVEPEAKILS